MENQIIFEKKITKEKILTFEKILALCPGATKNTDEICPVEHEFVDNIYRRKIFMPKGVILTSKIHKTKHFYFILSGKLEVITEDGIELIEAPKYGITYPGTKRVLKILEDTIWITIHLNLTNTKDLKEIEKEIIAKNFNEIENKKKEKQL